MSASVVSVASRMSISRVHSVTETSMMFMIPMPPPSNANDAVIPSSRVTSSLTVRSVLSALALLLFLYLQFRCDLGKRLSSLFADPACRILKVKRQVLTESDSHGLPVLRPSHQGTAAVAAIQTSPQPPRPRMRHPIRYGDISRDGLHQRRTRHGRKRSQPGADCSHETTVAFGVQYASCQFRLQCGTGRSSRCAGSNPARVSRAVETGHMWLVEKIEISGGFLPGLSVNIPRGLTCIIGARGSGKSTLAEAVRFAICGISAAPKHCIDLKWVSL